MVVFNVAQVKKDQIRNRITKAAETLFSEAGYVGTSMTAISISAGVSKSNIYVYFGSKLEILWAISDDWLREYFRTLETEIEAIKDPRSRLRHLFVALWCDLPSDRNGFANNMMQALSTTSDSDGYSQELLGYCKNRFTEILLNNTESSPDQAATWAHIAFMAFDGFAIGNRLGASEAEAIQSAEAFSALMSE